MSSLSRELVFLILQFLDEEKFKETVHRLEQESGFYFNMKHFEDAVLGGNWEEVERYLSGFTKVDDNRYSMKIFFEIRKQKYLEALDKRERAKAVEILMKDIKVFAAFNEELFKEITQLLTLENFRENEQLSKYGDTKSARSVMLSELKKLIEANPLFRDKLQFPNLKNSRLRTLINQSLNWQHQLCKNPRPNPDIKTLFYDHSCSQPNGARVASPAPPVMNVMQKPGGFPQLGPHAGAGVIAQFQPQATALPAPLTGWMANASNATPMPHPAMSASPLVLAAPPNSAALLKHPVGNPHMDYHSADSEHVHKRPRLMGTSEEASLPTTHLPVAYAGISRNHHIIDELPKNVAVTLNLGSSVTSMDFHPSQPTFILVGTNVGDISIWEVSSRERLAHRNFKVWELSACSTLLQSTLVKDPSIVVNRVLWSPDGNQFGVAYSKHLVHFYDFNGREDLVQHFEIDAHIGSVNDIAFSQPNKKLCIVTCGDDKTIKVWDAATAVVQYTYEGHEAPVYSICPHSKENIHFIFSTSLDGKIKAWLYDNGGSRVDYTAPGQWCTSMAYSADGTRLFSCGSSKDGDSYIVEWNESEGSLKRTYSGFRKRSTGVVHFDTTKSRFLAAGDEFMIKFWDMDNTNLLTTADAEGGLPASPRIRFNKLGSLLAVSTIDNCIKILANAEGFQLLRSFESRLYSASRLVSEAKASTLSPLVTVSAVPGTSTADADRSAQVAPVGALQSGDNRTIADVKPRVLDELLEKSNTWKLVEINESTQCCSLRLPDNLLAVKVSRLIYTNTGLAILALASNAVHKLWKWPKTDRNVSGKATTATAPQIWQPTSGILMTNETSDANTEEAIHCFALSKNDSYVLSASGGKISLFNMMSFKTMTTFMPPPPAATFLAFHPQDNNIIAIGMDDSSIQIYNVRVDEVKSKLRGHQKRITGLAFSNVLNILISSGADSQLCVWGMNAWDKQGSKFLQIPPGRTPGPVAETKVQFHQDQVQFLVVHESQIAIYEARKMECLKQWVPRDGLVTHATYSCDSQMIYASFTDGSVSVFTSILRLRCRISPAAYINSPPSSSVYPVVLAANPTDPNQFALGLTDGGVHVLEPLESQGKWGSAPPLENVVGSSVSQPAGNPSSDQPSR
ncbi:protein TPR3-like [Phalaenopsis equestris]|uniref:protein TPR3-like n=1 Tax=Phalaenopsis equestris TaxID=78828 RepID=UPI0009E22FE1|nr:protein TPR3-like [Phalaenopsis equestris]